MIFGSFGSVAFLPLGSPETLEIEDRSDYAQLNVLGAAPTLQWIFDDLTNITMEIYLHQQWSLPYTTIQALQQMRLSHQPAPLTLNYENRGNFVIKKLREKDIWRADDSTIIAAKIELELVQWAGQLPATASPVPQPSVVTGSSLSLPGSSPLLVPPNVLDNPTLDFLAVPLTQITGLF